MTRNDRPEDGPDAVCDEISPLGLSAEEGLDHLNRSAVSYDAQHNPECKPWPHKRQGKARQANAKTW